MDEARSRKPAPVPVTRAQALSALRAVGDSVEKLSAEQRARLRDLYFLDTDASVADLVKSGRIRLVSDGQVREFLKQLRQHGINDGAELETALSFLRSVTEFHHVELLEREIPRIVRGYFRKELLAVLREGQS